MEAKSTPQRKYVTFAKYNTICNGRFTYSTPMKSDDGDTRTSDDPECFPDVSFPRDELSGCVEGSPIRTSKWINKEFVEER